MAGAPDVRDAPKKKRAKVKNALNGENGLGMGRGR